MEMNRIEIKRGMVFLLDMKDMGGIGSEQKESTTGSNLRPCVIIQNNVGNKFSPCTIVALATSKINKAKLPTHVLLNKELGIEKDSVLMLEQIKTVDTRRLKHFCCMLPPDKMKELNKALEVSVEVGEAGEMLKGREIKIIKEKVTVIEELDIVIKSWLHKNKPVELIYEFIEERKARLEELKQFCEKNHIDYNIYYNDEIMSKKAV